MNEELLFCARLTTAGKMTGAEFAGVLAKHDPAYQAAYSAALAADAARAAAEEEARAIEAEVYAAFKKGGSTERSARRQAREARSDFLADVGFAAARATWR